MNEANMLETFIADTGKLAGRISVNRLLHHIRGQSFLYRFFMPGDARKCKVADGFALCA